ncbi:MAG: ABC transporter ATP-binding protein [Planctomycetes bacterium]|nr:ABC transporter ATP-binding protein [Planctomycetota bacterium]
MNEIVLETRGLTKYFGPSPALDHLSVKIPKGTVCGFLGRNGAGKTTAIRLMLGLLQPTAGSASLLGCPSDALTPEIRARVGYVTEGHRLFGSMTIQGIERFQRAFFPDQWDGKFFTEMIEYFELSPRQKIKRLSNGERAQVSLALTLAPHPELLIMDDPTLGLDAAIRRQFLEGMVNLIMKEGRTVLFSSHILGDVERVCDRLLVLDRGVLRADCTLEEFRQAVQKVTFSFKETAPPEIDLPGVLQTRRSDTTLEVVLVNSSPDQITRWAEQHQVEQHSTIPISLEDQFIDFTASRQSKPLFRWEEN